MEQSDLLVFLCRHLENTGIPYFITGSQATIVYGEPRFTNDIDVVVSLHETSCDAFCDGFPQPEFYLNRETARQECRRQGMFNIIHPDSGQKIDVVIAKHDSYDQMRLKRGVKIPIADDLVAVFSSPEDIVLQKMKWYHMGGGDRHLRDIAGVLKVRGAGFDRDYVSDQAKNLGVGDIWTAIQSEIK